VRINTNSLASTDNLPAFSGYRNQRERMLAMGLKVYEYRPDAQVQRLQMQQRIPALTGDPPIFSLHAKSIVVDAKVVYIGTFNLDPRSENLNTEVGAVIHDPGVARAVQAQIERDMAAGNSWNAATDDPDRHVAVIKRAKVDFCSCCLCGRCCRAPRPVDALSSQGLLALRHPVRGTAGSPIATVRHGCGDAAAPRTRFAPPLWKTA
jgi:hypothetical protein